MSLGISDLKVIKSEQEVSCKGLFFRGTVNIFATRELVRETRQVKLLKRMSCKGCEKCSGIMDHIQEDVNGDAYDTFLADISPGVLYKLHIHYWQPDWETNVWEVDNICFEEVVE